MYKSVLYSQRESRQKNPEFTGKVLYSNPRFVTSPRRELSFQPPIPIRFGVWAALRVVTGQDSDNQGAKPEAHRGGERADKNHNKWAKGFRLRPWWGLLQLVCKIWYLGKFWRTVRNREAWCAILTGLQRGGHNWLTKQQQTTGNNQEGLSFSIRGDTSEFVGYFAGQYTSYILVQNGYSNRENHL